MSTIIEIKKLPYPYNFLAYLGEPVSELKNLSENQMQGLNYVLSELPVRIQNIIHMYFVERLSFAQCGETLKISPANVRRILGNAKRYLLYKKYHYIEIIIGGVKRKEELTKDKNLYAIPLSYLNLSSYCVNRIKTSYEYWGIKSVGELLNIINMDIFWYKKCSHIGKRSVSSVYIALVKKQYASKDILQNLVTSGLYTEEEVLDIINTELNVKN